MPKSVALWEPYCHRSDAEFHLSKFADRVLGPKAGVIFFDGMAAVRLKPSIPDADGDAINLVVSSSRLPVAAPDPLSCASPQTINQLAQAWTQRLDAASNRGAALGQGLAKARAKAGDFIGAHQIGFDTAAVVGDTFGVLAGVVSVAAIMAGGVALAPALGVVAGAAAALLLIEDGRMLRYELRGDDVRKNQLKETWHYKLVETVGPILALPDLAVSGGRTLASLPKVSREVGEAAEEAMQATSRLADQRNAINTFSRANLDNPDQLLMRQQANQMREQARGLANNVRTAQKKLTDASRELMLLRTIEAPAYMATIYGTGVYGISPPDPVAHGVNWLTERMAESSHRDPNHPAHALAPQRLGSSNQVGSPPTLLQFQVGVCHHPEYAQ
ncbi:hypothetical protein WI80_06100 [Burkholderia ubonensis]|uniref:hypothetical protein n=1 Tax=Burkholderia ubonensis TaxID=101571 RepID=UPI0007573AEA|nr:hypothetical protein [Burkholderia ubonensis]KVD16597.1 hypothetical protein WI80_06100 [Burkholderia ubonensis]KVU11937.1 hypothetical protein WK63_21070 [Burkholderia ubonensis]